MNQPEYILEDGTRVVTHDRLGSTDGMGIGHGGDVYWVRHDDGEIAAYCFDEFELAPDPPTLGDLALDALRGGHEHLHQPPHREGA